MFLLLEGGYQFYNFPLTSYSETQAFFLNIYSENIRGYCLHSGLKNKYQLDYALVYHTQISTQEGKDSITSACVLLPLFPVKGTRARKGHEFECY